MERGTAHGDVDRLFLQVQRRLAQIVRQSLPEGASPSQYWLLKLLAEEGPLTMTDIARRLRVGLSAATSIVDPVIENGWAERRRRDEDRRVVQVHLTASGRAVLQQFDEARQRILQDTFLRLSAEELEQLRAILAKLAAALETARPLPLQEPPERPDP
ncbi:MAG: MarR family transcriptional regulator [Firmicutes bacterium]|nr:MarR family transcriptional regulator [Bacillota bacterium]